MCAASVALRYKREEIQYIKVRFIIALPSD